MRYGISITSSNWSTKLEGCGLGVTEGRRGANGRGGLWKQLHHQMVQGTEHKVHPRPQNPPLEFKVSSAVNTRSPHCSKETDGGLQRKPLSNILHLLLLPPGKPLLDASGLYSSSFLGFQAGAVSGYCTEQDPDLVAKTGKQTTQTLRTLGNGQAGHLPLKLYPREKSFLVTA